MYTDKEEKEINERFYNNFINTNQKEEDYPFDLYPLFNNSSTISSSNDSSFNPQEESLNIKNILEILEVLNPEKDSIFTPIKIDSPNEETFCQKKRYSEKRRRRENQDNIRKKIRRGFLNRGIIKKLNSILKNNGSESSFEKFQKNLINNVTKKANKEFMNMTLKEIFEKKELYQESELKNYEQNLNLIKSMEIQENKEIQNILNKKLCVIYEDYLNSKEFLIDDINWLKNKNMDNEYIERYKYLAKHFIEFVLS